MRELYDYYATVRIGDCTYQFADNISTDDFNARLLCENGRVRLIVTPDKSREKNLFDTLAITAKTKITNNDRLFVNGYQSWTDSKEYETHEKMTGIDHIPKALVRKYNFDKYGDYNFTSYSDREGDIHGFSYGYIREGSEFTLFGSLDETDGFTLIRILSKDGEVSFEKGCEGRLYGSDEFTALDIAVFNGNENEVFDSFFEMSGIKCRDAKPLRGYTSWYRHYQDISEQKLLHDLEGVAAAGSMDIFQIDDGYQKGVGDWLKIDAGKFPHGMKYVSDKIHEKGLMSGIWLAPFVVEKNSYIFRHRQDMLLCDSEGRPVAAGCNWSGSYALDIYNEDVVRYLEKVFDTILNKWGFDMVKLDFLYAVAIIPYNGKSRGEIMHEGMQLLRRLVGNKLILGCGVPLASAFGVVDYCRIGCDVGLSWNDNMLMQLTHRERVSTKNSMQNTIFRRQLDKRAFLNDPDVFLLRDDNISLSGIQKQALAIVNDLFGSVYFTSDDMLAYNDKQKKVLDFAVSLRGCGYEDVDIKNGYIYFTYTRNGRKTTAELSSNGNIHVVR
ncbi:MAG: alpha-galactosidase [Ruminococcus sp.]|nr:alpha-galactosidase [Ruminococcus sp.]